MQDNFTNTTERHCTTLIFGNTSVITSTTVLILLLLLSTLQQQQGNTGKLHISSNSDNNSLYTDMTDRYN